MAKVKFESADEESDDTGSSSGTDATESSEASSEDSPIEDSNSDKSEEESGTEAPQNVPSNRWVGRLTPYGQYGFEEAKAFVASLCEPEECWVLSEEMSEKQHFHYVVQTDLTLAACKAIKDKFIISYFPKPWKQGMGNNYSYLKAEKPRTDENANMICPAISYTIKDRRYEYQGYKDEYIAACLKESYAKPSRRGFQKDLDKLFLEFRASACTQEWLTIQIALLKAAHSQTVNWSLIESHSLSRIIQRDGEEYARASYRRFKDKNN